MLIEKSAHARFKTRGIDNTHRKRGSTHVTPLFHYWLDMFLLFLDLLLKHPLDLLNIRNICFV